MASLEKLYKKYGTGVWFTNIPGLHYGINPFKIIGEHDAENFDVQYQNGATGYILKECKDTNDYCLLLNTKTKRVTFKQWVKEYHPIPDEWGYIERQLDSITYEQFCGINPLTLWTELSEDLTRIIRPGPHSINSMAYYITEKEYDPLQSIEVFISRPPFNLGFFIKTEIMPRLRYRGKPTPRRIANYFAFRNSLRKIANYFERRG